MTASTRALLDALTARLDDPTKHHLVVSAQRTTDRRWLSSAHRADQVDQAAAVASTWDDQGHNVYVRHSLLGAPPATPNGRGRADETSAAVAFVLDVDLLGPGHHQGSTGLPLPASHEQAMAPLRCLEPPSIRIATGGGWHLWWTHTEPDTDDPVAMLNQWADGIVQLGADAGIHYDRPDPARVMRLPGTHRRKPNVPENLVTIEEVTGWPADGLGTRPWCPTTYDAAALLERLPTPPAPAPQELPAIAHGLRLEPVSGIGPADAMKHVPWATLFAPLGWTHVGNSTVDGTTAELWQRPGASSPYSVKAIPGGACIVWSDQLGLQPGRGYSAWHIYTHLYHRGDQRAAAQAIRHASRQAAAA